MGGAAGVCGSLQCAWPGLWSDCGLGGSSFLPSAARHQHLEVCHPVLLQEGEALALTPPTRHTLLGDCVPNPLLNCHFPPTDNTLPKLSASAEDVSFYHLHLLFSGGAPVWMGFGNSCLDLQSFWVSVSYLPVTVATQLLFLHHCKKTCCLAILAINFAWKHFSCYLTLLRTSVSLFLKQDPSLLRLWSFPLIQYHVDNCSRLIQQSL